MGAPITLASGVVAGYGSAMLVVAAFMADGLRSITGSLSPGHMMAAYVDDLSATVFAPRRVIVRQAVAFGEEVMATVAALGLQVNAGKTAIICVWRPAALAVSAALGVPTRPRGVFAGRNLGCDHAPLRACMWRRSGSALLIGCVGGGSGSSGTGGCVMLRAERAPPWSRLACALR